MFVHRGDIVHPPYSWFVKLVGRWSPTDRMLRLFRVVWSSGEGPGTGFGHCAKFSVALRPALFHFARELWGWRMTVLGVRLHYKREYGGWMV